MAYVMNALQRAFKICDAIVNGIVLYNKEKLVDSNKGVAGQVQDVADVCHVGARVVEVVGTVFLDEQTTSCISSFARAARGVSLVSEQVERVSSGETSFKDTEVILRIAVGVIAGVSAAPCVCEIDKEIQESLKSIGDAALAINDGQRMLSWLIVHMQKEDGQEPSLNLQEVARKLRSLNISQIGRDFFAKEIPPIFHHDVVFRQNMCPLTKKPIRNPVYFSGNTVLYEREELRKYLVNNKKVPGDSKPRRLLREVEEARLVKNTIDDRIVKLVNALNAEISGLQSVYNE